MNQTYLQGLASDMDGPDSAVFFEATPENIAAFLMRHQTAEKSAVGAADGRVLLTARMGFIDICPDQEYLTQKLLPLYSKIQVGDLPAPPLSVVPKDIALADGCPRPDWNYLRFDGYSDKKYRALASGEAILPLQWHGETISMDLQVRSYQDAGKLALMLVDWNDGEPEPWGDLTVNLGCPVEKDCAFIDINDLGPDILPWIENNGLGKPTGRNQRSGFVVYPEYRFDAGRLRELDPDGYQEYSQMLEGPGRAQPQKKKGGRQR